MNVGIVTVVGSSFSGNICLEFSVLCFCSAGVLYSFLPPSRCHYEKVCKLSSAWKCLGIKTVVQAYCIWVNHWEILFSIFCSFWPTYLVLICTNRIIKYLISDSAGSVCFDAMLSLFMHLGHHAHLQLLKGAHTLNCRPCGRPSTCG